MSNAAQRLFGKAMVSRLFIRVPNSEWPAVKRGIKREWRIWESTLAAVVEKVELPTPVLLFPGAPPLPESKLAVITNSWVEPLGAIGPESLAAEGVDTLAEFKQRWCASRERRFNPLKKVRVFQSRPWEDADEERFALRIIRHLYPEELR